MEISVMQPSNGFAIVEFGQNKSYDEAE